MTLPAAEVARLTGIADERLQRACEHFIAMTPDAVLTPNQLYLEMMEIAQQTADRTGMYVHYWMDHTSHALEGKTLD